MKKTILIGILILFTVSCAPLMEETWTVTTPKGPVTVRHYDPARELLLGFYISSLITNPPKAHNDLLLSSYYYPLVVPPYNPLSNYYCPPDIWKAWSPLQRSLWIESGREAELRDYEYKLQSINDMQMFQMKLDAQSLIDDLENKTKRAKDELESKKEDAEDAADELKRAADDAKLKLENAAWWAKFRLESAAENADFERLVAENAGTTEEQRKTFSTRDKFDITVGLPPFNPSAPTKESDLIDLLNRIPVKTETPVEVSGAEKKLGSETDFDFGFLANSLPGKEPPVGGEIGQVIGKSEDQVEVTRWSGSSLVEKKFVSVGVDYAKRARPFVFLLEVPMPGKIVVYGRRWPPKDPINWREEKEVSRIVKNGLANAIKEIIDELGER